MVAELVLSPAATLVDGLLPSQLSTIRKYSLLLVFCLAQLIDVFNNSALFSAIPTLITSLDMTESESTWIISAYQLTFASFLLISGRISDVYNPKAAFITGFSGLGLIAIGSGFVRSKIVLIVLRALSGMVASLTIPAALTLLVKIFPEPAEQARAIGIFGGCGAIGNVLGLIIGAIFIQYTSWSWVFWFIPTVALPISALSYFLIPPQYEDASGDEPKSSSEKLKNLDTLGVASLILLIFAVTSGSSSGWGSATVLAPLIISPFLLAGFFFYERAIPAAKAAIPPATWFLPNFAVLFAVALLPYFWWVTIFTIFTNLWQGVYGWQAIDSAVHFLPVGIVAFAASWTGSWAKRVSPKWIIMAGEGLMIIATILMAFASAREAYWPFVFPAFLLGSTGATLAYTHANIAIFQTSLAESDKMAGTVGAIFNGALQLGSAVGIAAVTSVESSVEKRSSRGIEGYQGRAAAFWFLLGVVIVETAAVLIFYRRDIAVVEDAERVEAKTGDGEAKCTSSEKTSFDGASPAREPAGEIVEELTEGSGFTP
ncbi:MFS general substrate transporter [Punctularia strigosozonata HHB-11173 SS5]|uniref:MFS general substrate transporter n=1 Tax=Punctularia strigosozonata (strain HHB-11173) TaxID=741275 RepID=R7S2X7_PUNST|nr:MFS general substrate transporter [Punctularia strigosozonata HHB-11173 SS5]EIN04578.1 MFS general substrate transporter [Punctularia strigosozonata HHB-11173 SS5]